MMAEAMDDAEQVLTEGKDFYYDDSGLMVLTRDYLLERGYCCGNGCRNCPYTGTTLDRKGTRAGNQNGEKK